MMLTYAQSLNKALSDIMDEDKTVYIVGEDIRDPYGGAFKITKGLSTKYPDRVINTPISEAGITGVATGMALRKLRPVLEIMFGDFISLAMDQILNNISKLSWVYNKKVKIPIVIRMPMGGRRGYGPTHSQCIEKIFFGVPCIKIVAPSCFHNAGFLLKRSIADDDPVLFIEYKLDYTKKIRTENDFKKDGWYLVEESSNFYPILRLSHTNFEDDDITVVTYGGMAGYVEEAVKKLLYEEDIASEVIIPSLIKPYEECIDAILSSVKRTGRIVIVEEATKTNGWGAEIAAQLSDKAFGYIHAPIKRIAAKDLPIANTKVLEDYILPGINDIINGVKEII